MLEAWWHDLDLITRSHFVLRSLVMLALYCWARRRPWAEQYTHRIPQAPERIQWSGAHLWSYPVKERWPCVFFVILKQTLKKARGPSSFQILAQQSIVPWTHFVFISYLWSTNITNMTRLAIQQLKPGAFILYFIKLCYLVHLFLLPAHHHEPPAHSVEGVRHSHWASCYHLVQKL